MDAEEILRNAKFYAIDAVEIKPTDVIILKVKSAIDSNAAERIKAKMQEIFPNKILILSDGMELVIGRPE